MEAGHRLFARYAHAPNALGYCGPRAAAALQAVACGAPSGDQVDVPRLARGFSGAWPYQQMIAEVLAAGGTDLDPLSQEVGRAYWTTHELTEQVDTAAFGELLLTRFGEQAGHYWQHLTDELLPEVTPTHAFHVLGVYPWTRLLSSGLPEPLHVLDSCRIRAGEVMSVDDDGAQVQTDTLTWDGRQLGIHTRRAERVDRRTDDGYFTDGLEPGQEVAIHWGFVCDALTTDESRDLRASTARQIELTNARLGVG